MIKKHVIAGLGEIGKSIFQLISKSVLAVGYDTNEKLVNKNAFDKYESD